MRIARSISRDLMLVLAFAAVAVCACSCNKAVTVTDHPLEVTHSTLSKLQELRAKPKFADLPGVNTSSERARLEAVLNELLDRVSSGVSTHPRKKWVLDQFRSSLERVMLEDTEARERFGIYLEQVMDILNIQSSDGLLSAYL